jgi:amidohydrolase
MKKGSGESSMAKASNAILEEANALFDFTRSIRRDLHQHPELGFEEIRTGGIVAAELTHLGLEVRTGVARTGVVGLIEGSTPGPVILLRFDMDALPVREETGVEFASLVPGKMHACGHDGHVAVGLTVARLLNQHREELHGTVKLVFQPAEETMGGAEGMIKDGILESPAPDLAFALHIWNEKPVGWVGVVPGPFMSAAEIFKVKISGKGGHAALPNQTADPVAAAAQVITALQTLVSRNVSPLQSAVVSVTRISGGEAFNIIPSSVEFHGTIRTFENEVRIAVIKRFYELVEGIAASMGCKAEVEIQKVTPAVVNDQAAAERLQALFAQVLPGDTIDTQYRTMGSEDMAYILEKVPGCYFFVGSANPEKGLDYSHHHPKFNFDEIILPKAAALMTSAVLSYLGST